MQALAPFVQMALDCVHREYPNQVALRLGSAADLHAPSQLTPCFYGCYDWHSAVHGHWLLARVVHRFGNEALAADCRERLTTSLVASKIEAEFEHLRRRPGFERPYGLAWLLQLHAELHACPELRQLGDRLVPLVQIARSHLLDWLPKLSHPVRSGAHSQSAFALGLVLDWARDVGDTEVSDLVRRRARDFYASDHTYALHLEPSGEDFLSPSLGAADLMRRVMVPNEFANWFERCLPGGFDQEPVSVRDPSDGRLAHLDGLNLSRAWMLDGVLSVLPDQRMRRCRDLHAEHAMRSIDGSHYAGSHWLGTFAVYLMTGRGLS